MVQLLTVLSCTSSRTASSVLVSRPLGAEPFGVAGQLVATARFEHDASGERLALAEAVTGGVERLGGLGVGVGVKEPIERCEGVGAGLVDLPGLQDS